MTIAFIGQRQSARAVASLAITPRALSESAVALKWKARNYNGEWIDRKGQMIVEGSDLGCSRLRFVAEQPASVLRLVEPGETIELKWDASAVEDVARGTRERLRSVRLYGPSRKEVRLLDDPCTLLLVLGLENRPKDPRAVLGLAGAGDRIVAREIVEDTSLSWSERAMLPAVVAVDVVTLPLQAPFWAVWIMVLRHIRP